MPIISNVSRSMNSTPGQTVGPMPSGACRRRQVGAQDDAERLSTRVISEQVVDIYGATDVFRTTDGTLVNYRDVMGAEPGSGPFYELGGEPIVIRTGF